MTENNRRRFLQQMSLLPVIAALSPSKAFSSVSILSDHTTSTSNLKEDIRNKDSKLFFEISLAEWSFNKELFAGKMKNMDFPFRAKKEFGIGAVEYVNQFFMDKATDKAYLKELKQRCDDLGVASVRIMCDEEGDLGETDEKKRNQAVENHYKWVEAAQMLGCSDIRVNVRGKDDPGAVRQAAVQSLGTLTDFAKKYGIDVVVENHGGYSSDGEWIAGVMKQVNDPHCGLLPDWGNFCLKYGQDSSGESICLQQYDRYKGVEEMMPFAKGVSAKSYAFDKEGNETTIDFKKMLDITRKAGFTGYVGIEFEGNRPGITPEEGVRKTLALLKKWG